MFFMATFHLIMNGYRLLRGYADFRDIDGGPVAYIGNLRRWDHILKDTIYATQENLGSAAAVCRQGTSHFIGYPDILQIYRTWVLWAFDWKVIIVPTLMLMINIGTVVSVIPWVNIYIFEL